MIKKKKKKDYEEINNPISRAGFTQCVVNKAQSHALNKHRKTKCNLAACQVNTILQAPDRSKRIMGKNMVCENIRKGTSQLIKFCPFE